MITICYLRMGFCQPYRIAPDDRPSSLLARPRREPATFPQQLLMLKECPKRAGRGVILQHQEK